jgi:hypothetical protein
MKNMSAIHLQTSPAAVICNTLSADSHPLLLLTQSSLSAVPERQGMLCWWLRKRAAPNLFNQYLEVKTYPVVCTKMFAGEEWLLLYAEACSGQANRSTTLQQKLTRTLAQQHTFAHTRRGSLSPLRRSISALLGDDFFDPGLDTQVTHFLEHHVRVSYWLTDTLNLEDWKSLEIHWIRELRPLLNYRYNENAMRNAGNHVSRLSKIRYQEVVRRMRVRNG